MSELDQSAQAGEASLQSDEQSAALDAVTEGEQHEGDPPAPTESTDEDHGEEPEKPARGVQKRLNELTREKYEERRRADRLEQLLEQVLPRILDQDKAPERTPIDANAEPQLKDFDDYNAYLAALARHQVRQELATVSHRQMQEQQAAEAFVKRQRLDAAEAEYQKNHSDYVESRDALLAILKESGSQGAIEAIINSDNPPAVAHYLGKNLDEAQKIALLGNTQAALRIGAIAAKLEAQTKPVSKAPAPAQRVEGNGGYAKPRYKTSLDASAANDFEVFCQMREKEEAARRLRGY